MFDMPCTEFCTEIILLLSHSIRTLRISIFLTQLVIISDTGQKVFPGHRHQTKIHRRIVWKLLMNSKR